jgi:hypothetical protein
LPRIGTGSVPTWPPSFIGNYYSIRKIAITAISGVLIIPLWKNAKFWTFAFRDGIHLNSMFDSVQIVRMHTLAWEFSKKDVIGGKENQLLVIKIGSVRGV